MAENVILNLELITKLKEIYDVAGELITLAKDKEELLIKGDDYEAIGDITSQEEKLSFKLAALEDQRQQITLNICKELGLDDQNVTISKISQKINADMAKKLTENADKLNSRLISLKDQGALNKDLIEIKMSFKSFLLESVTNDSDGQSGVYGAKGEQDFINPQISSLFDSEV